MKPPNIYKPAPKKSNYQTEKANRETDLINNNTESDIKLIPLHTEMPFNFASRNQAGGQIFTLSEYNNTSQNIESGFIGVNETYDKRPKILKINFPSTRKKTVSENVENLKDSIHTENIRYFVNKNAFGPEDVVETNEKTYNNQRKVNCRSPSPISEVRNTSFNSCSNRKIKRTSNRVSYNLRNIEGMLYKKRKTIFNQWKKVFCKLETYIFKIYKNYKTFLLSYALDLRDKSIEVNKSQENLLIYFVIKGTHEKKIILKSHSHSSYHLWINTIDLVIRRINSFSLKTIIQDKNLKVT